MHLKDGLKGGSFIGIVLNTFQTDVVKPIEDNCVAPLYLGLFIWFSWPEQS